MYESQVTFVMDTICPWTYFAKKRLDQALEQVRSSSSSAISFTLHFSPFQPSPNLEATIPDRAAHTLHHQHNGKLANQHLVQVHFLSLAKILRVPIGFTGPTGNSFPAHRVIQQVQEVYGTDTANKLVDAVFRLYFAEGRHPGEDEMLIEACVEAGVDEKEAKGLLEDKEKGERETKEMIRRIGMDIDSVPTVIIEGRKRDLTLTGLKEVADYVKAFGTITKESTE